MTDEKPSFDSILPKMTIPKSMAILLLQVIARDGKAETISQEEAGCAKSAAESCPVQAISIK